MAGHFRRRGTRWCFWLELEPGPNGERRQRTMGGFRSRKEAEAASEELRGEIRRGELLGLRWKDVDLEVRRPAIVRALVLVDRKLVLSEPTTPLLTLRNGRDFLP